MAEKLNMAIAALVAVIAVCALVVITLPEFILNWSRAISRHPYVAATGWDLPVLVVVPAIMALIYGVMLKIVGRASEAKMQSVFKVVVSLSCIAILLRIVYGMFVSVYLSHAGYFKCWALSDPLFMLGPSGLGRKNFVLEIQLP